MKSNNALQRTKIKQRFLVKDVRNIPWDDVICENEIKVKIEEHVIEKLNCKGTGKENPFGILLYGLPGTGKSHLIEAALSHIQNVTSFKLSIYDLFSKYFVESRGVLTELIKSAVDQEPSVIIIDDVDVLCRNNYPNENLDELRKSLRTELMNLIQSKPHAAVQLILCSTRPLHFDEEFNRSLEVKIYISLPTEEIRTKILTQFLSEVAVPVASIHQVAAQTTNYSPSDLICLTRDAQMIAVRSICKSSHFKLLESGKYVACDSSDPQATEMKFSDITNTDMVEFPPLSEDDLITSMNNSQPSFTAAEIMQIGLYNT